MSDDANKFYATLEDWLYEVENYGLRAERIPPDAMPWIEEAWSLGELSAMPRMSDEAASKLADKIISAINMWDETELAMRWANDGGGHFDFMGMKVTEHGRDCLIKVIEEALKDAANVR